MVMFLAGSCQCCKGTAVEAVPQGDDRIIFRSFFLRRVFPGHLDGTFVGFPAGIAEENFFHAGFVAEDFRQLHAGFRVIKVGHVLHFAQLVDDSLLPLFVGDAEAGNADAGAHVDIFFSIRVFGDASLAADDFHWEPGIGIGYVLII